MRGGYRQNAGRKKGFSAIEAEKARELICQKMSENLTPIVNVLIKRAKTGDIRAIRELFDRAYGKTASASEFSRSIEIPLPIPIVDAFQIDKIEGVEITIRD